MAAPTLRALVLIYDIRGFTSASRRVGTADLGAFATAAHRVILDLFSACPPGFVKNLGDGHLLVWETGEGLDPALLDAVLSAARRAPAAFASFVAGQGALGARLPKQVGIGLAHGEAFKSDDYYGITLNLAARLQNEARPEGLALSESVFDAAARRDQKLRDEFSRAHVRLKGLGSTIVWVKRPFSWARVGRAVLPWAFAVGLPLVYVALADAGLRLPLGEPVRKFLDRRSASLFRPVHSDAEVRAAAAQWRAKLLAFFDTIRDARGWIRYSVSPHEEKAIDVWTTSQAHAALLRAPDIDAARLRRTLGDLAGPFGPDGTFIEDGGVIYGWPAHEGFAHSEAEPALWTAAATAIALGRPGLIEERDRPAWMERLRKAQRAAELHVVEADGGWNMFPNQEDLSRHSPYSSALALLALLEAQAAGLPWGDGGVARRDALLHATARWLQSRFDPKAPVPGWRGTPSIEDRVSPGLTLQLYAELLRAESSSGVSLSREILQAMPGQLEAMVGKALMESYDAGENQLRFQSHRDKAESARTGKPVWSTGAESVNFLWHPWGIEAAVRWLDRARRRGGEDPADVLRVSRVLGHLVIDLGDDAFKEATSGFTFVASETLYGLSSVPRP